jgi:hypothetical protein
MARRRKRSFLGHIHSYLFPHKGNNYHPGFFKVATLGALAISLLILEGAYFADTNLLEKHTNFLAAVLPGALLSLTNTDRASVDAPPVAENATLDQAAQLAANDMAAKGYFAHVSPSGTTPWDWLDQAGYKYSYAGENLAVNFTDSSDVEKAWMASPSHHANIVKPQYTEAGIGTANGTYQGEAVTFVVQFFATPAPAAVAAAAPPAPAATPRPVATKPTPANTDIVDVRPEPGATVLGAQTTPAPAPSAPQPSVVTKAVASPTYAVQSIALLLLMIVAALLAIAVAVKIRVQHPRLIAGGLSLIALACGVILLNSSLEAHVLVPSDSSQAASVINALQ